MAGWDNYWGKYGRGFFFPRLDVNSRIVVIALIIISLLAVSVLGFRTGNYIKTLEKNTTDLGNELLLCNESYSNASLALNTCVKNLNSKTSSYNSCQSQLSSTADTLSSCQNDLDDCQADFDTLSLSLTDISAQLNECEDDLSALSSAQSNLDAMKVNYAKDYCCIFNNKTVGQTTYYKIENNKVTCFTNSTSGTTAVTC